MNISDLILRLMAIRDQFGNLPICGHDEMDANVVDEDAVEITESNRPAAGVFIE